jgi:hypothetical protein
MTLFVGYLAGSIAILLLLIYASLRDEGGKNERAKAGSIEH